MCEDGGENPAAIAVVALCRVGGKVLAIAISPEIPIGEEADRLSVVLR